MEESCILIFLIAYQDWFLQEVHKRNYMFVFDNAAGIMKKDRCCIIISSLS
jgi:hypothetical protein